MSSYLLPPNHCMFQFGAHSLQQIDAGGPPAVAMRYQHRRPAPPPAPIGRAAVCSGATSPSPLFFTWVLKKTAQPSSIDRPNLLDNRRCPWRAATCPPTSAVVGWHRHGRRLSSSISLQFRSGQSPILSQLSLLSLPCLLSNGPTSH